jgi:membrane protease YdiL (CAAX protease family)
MKEIKDNLQIIILMTIINLFVLWNFISKGQTKHGIGYFIFFYVAIFIIYFFTKRYSSKTEIIINEPKKELIVSSIFSLLGLVFLGLNYLIKSKLLPDTLILKVPVGIGNFLFAMPFGLLIYFLIKKYRIRHFGINFKPLNYLLLGFIIWGATGLFAITFNENGVRFNDTYKELGGVIGWILGGVIGAALFEEFSRFILQSRFEKIVKINGVNILFATTLWAFLHFPMSYYKTENIISTLTYCIQIIPLGYIWGYLTQRTKSIIPSTLAHGFNYFGLQNG